MEKDEKKGTSEMPAPQNIDYNIRYRLTDVFKEDLYTLLKELPYVEARKYMDIVEESKGVMPIAILNGFLRSLANIPYKYIYRIMDVINSGDQSKLDQYFVKIEQEKP